MIDHVAAVNLESIGSGKIELKYSQTSVIERFCSRPNRFSTKKLRLRLRT